MIARTIYRRGWAVGLTILMAIGMTAGLSIAVARAATVAPAAALAGDDPNWPRVASRNISESPEDKPTRPSIAANGAGHLAIVWRDRRSGDEKQQVYASLSSDDGQTWSTPEAVSTTLENSGLPDVAFAGEQAFAVWFDGDSPPFKMYESEIGVAGVRTISSPIDLDLTETRIAAITDRLHVVFSAGALPPQIYHTSRLTDAAWPVAQKVYTSASGAFSSSPAIAMGPTGDTVHVVWEESSMMGEAEVFVMYVTGTVQQDAGVAWHSPITLSEVITQAYRPGVVVDSQGVAHFTWGEGEVGEAGREYEQYVWYARYGGAVESVKIDSEHFGVNSLSPTFVTPDITLHEGEGETTVCITWHGFRPGASNEEEILISCSSDEGASWTGPHNVSQSSGDESVQGLRSIRSSVASDAAGRQHVVWREQSDEGWEVYHTYGLNNTVYLPLVMKAGRGG